MNAICIPAVLRNRCLVFHLPFIVLVMFCCSCSGGGTNEATIFYESQTRLTKSELYAEDLVLGGHHMLDTLLYWRINLDTKTSIYKQSRDLNLGVTIITEEHGYNQHSQLSIFAEYKTPVTDRLEQLVKTSGEPQKKVVQLNPKGEASSVQFAASAIVYANHVKKIPYTKNRTLNGVVIGADGGRFILETDLRFHFSDDASKITEVFGKVFKEATPHYPNILFRRVVSDSEQVHISEAVFNLD